MVSAGGPESVVLRSSSTSCLYDESTTEARRHGDSTIDSSLCFRVSVVEVRLSAQAYAARSAASVAFMVMLALSTRDTGQPFLALLAASSNLARSALGTRAFTSRWMAVMVKP